MGRAEELFLRIKTRGAAEVHDMIGERFVEELFLDYKRSSTRLPARKLSDEDRKNLAKAIAGFGNSEGGVVVWGWIAVKLMRVMCPLRRYPSPIRWR